MGDPAGRFNAVPRNALSFPTWQTSPRCCFRDHYDRGIGIEKARRHHFACSASGPVSEMVSFALASASD
jgi:hypothetical protein